MDQLIDLGTNLGIAIICQGIVDLVGQILVCGMNAVLSRLAEQAFVRSAMRLCALALALGLIRYLIRNKNLVYNYINYYKKSFYIF